MRFSKGFCSFYFEAGFAFDSCSHLIFAAACDETQLSENCYCPVYIDLCSLEYGVGVKTYTL